MNSIFKGTDKVGDIVVRFPQAADVFKKYHIDFCCGGNRPLYSALEAEGVSENELLESLNKAYLESETKKESYMDWHKAKTSEIIDYVVVKHHAYLHRELPIIGELVTKILRAHGTHHGEELMKVHKLFSTLRADLEEHLIKEEVNVFPLLKAYEKNPSPELMRKAQDAIVELEREHDTAGNILKELRRVTGDYKVPEDGCPTYSATFQKLEELESDMFNHVHAENNVLFRRFLS